MFKKYNLSYKLILSWARTSVLNSSHAQLGSNLTYRENNTTWQVFKAHSQSLRNSWKFHVPYCSLIIHTNSMINTRNHKHRRAAAKPAACAKPLMLSTLGRKGKREGRREGRWKEGEEGRGRKLTRVPVLSDVCQQSEVSQMMHLVPLHR